MSPLVVCARLPDTHRCIRTTTVQTVVANLPTSGKVA